MFIKWREENKPSTPEEEARFAPLRPAWASANKQDTSNHRFYAYLAKSQRVEGKPRQKVIAYLGSIPAWATGKTYSDEWCGFWYKVHCSLLLANITPNIYSDTLSAIAKRVERPSYEQLIEVIREGFASHPQWHKDYKTVCQVIERSDSYLELLYLNE